MEIDEEMQYSQMQSHQVAICSDKEIDNHTNMSLTTMACCEIIEHLTGFDPIDSLTHYKECVEPLIKNDHNC